MARLRHAGLGIVLGAAALAAGASSEPPSSCSSDGQRAPVALLDRFISADCADCWLQKPALHASPSTVALDWIVPGTQGEDAPLAVAASRDASLRLRALGLPAPATLTTEAHPTLSAGGWHLRVAHGPELGGYIGASIELRAPGHAGLPVRAWLALVETLPVGTEGSVVERNLVRNVLIPAWDGHEKLSKQKRFRLYESRPMNVPTGARPERLRVIGWVEDAQGRVRVIAQSRCASAGRRG
jgi:hypothetical protein